MDEQEKQKIIDEIASLKQSIQEMKDFIKSSSSSEQKEEIKKMEVYI